MSPFSYPTKQGGSQYLGAKNQVFLLETASLSQNEREDLLAHEKDMRLIGGS